MNDIPFLFNGQPIAARAGQSLAAALAEAGRRSLRDTAGGAQRGMFCGMGVCQDCLVTVDGAPNQRACMTVAKAGMVVQRQIALPKLSQPGTGPAGHTRTIEPDVLVIGGGAGGLSAAIEARRAGVTVILLDERKVPGGQFYKQPANAAMLDAQQKEGAALVAEAAASGAEIIAAAEIWGAFDGPSFMADCGGSALVARPRTAIVATGAYERPVFAPGWTLPGVMTTGAAQTLWRSYRTLPGRRVAFCGSGPLNLQVALELARGGADVALIAERAPSPAGRPAAALAMLAAGPATGAKGAAMLAELKARGITPRHRTELVRVEAQGHQLAARFRSASGTETTHVVDALCMNAGFEPQNEILRLLGAEMRYDPTVGHLRCNRGPDMQTSVTGIYAVGDCAGLGGAPRALAEGRIAGRAAAQAAHGEAPPADADGQRRLARIRRFQSRLWALYDISPQRLHDVPPETLICRCEELTLGQLQHGITTQPAHAGTLKRATRAGMGRCQGRYCGPVLMRLVAEAAGKAIDDRSYFAPRVPIKPMGIAAMIAGEDALDDLPQLVSSIDG